MSAPIKILPLGGLGEIGKNMMVVEREDRIVIVDTGVMFPTAEMLGIDLVLPDFGYLRGRIDDIEAIVLTHGHEDHVGALPYVLREIGIPPAIYGGALTMGLVRSKLDEHKLRDVPLQVLAPGERVSAGPFEIETIHLAHSIPDARAVALHTDLGAILVTGDYRFDQTPVDGKPADMARLAELGAEGVLCLCGDSTNANRPGFAVSESAVGPALRETFARCSGRVVVTSFASNVHRVQQAIDAAVALDRRVALVGRSMRKNFNIASNLDMAHAPEGVMIQPREIEDFPDEKLVIISTGSQGEPLSALRRMAHGDHRDVDLRDGDTVVFSATAIPGNERAVNETIDRLYQIGAEVITAADAPIHTSGHGSQEELKLMLNMTKPRFVMPAHGDHRRLKLHTKLAHAVGIDPANTFHSKNGLTLELSAKGAVLTDDIGSGVIYVDGVDIGEPDEAAIRDRRTLADDGVFLVVATIDAEDGSTVSPAEVIFRGVPYSDDVEDVSDDLAGVVADALAKAAKDGLREPNLIQQHLHDAVAEFVYDRLRRRPLVLPVVVEV